MQNAPRRRHSVPVHSRPRYRPPAHHLCGGLSRRRYRNRTILLRYIAIEHQGQGKPLLPAPVAAILSSPWVNVYSAVDPAFARLYKHVSTDDLPSERQAWGAQAYVTGEEGTAAEAYISSHRHAFRTRALLLFCMYWRGGDSKRRRISICGEYEERGEQGA